MAMYQREHGSGASTSAMSAADMGCRSFIADFLLETSKSSIGTAHR